jgi:acylphosphatase
MEASEEGAAPECLAKIWVRGRVQGVGFRYSTLKTANSLHLKGYVKNMPDDIVFIAAQGNAGDVETLIEWCRTGPPHAMVESEEYTIHPSEGFTSFQVR